MLPRDLGAQVQPLLAWFDDRVDGSHNAISRRVGKVSQRHYNPKRFFLWGE